MRIRLRISTGGISRSRSWMRPCGMSLIASIATPSRTIGVRFAGGDTMYAHAFEEQEKLVKYTGLLTNCIILDNTLEISAALNALAREGYRPSIDELAALSPYQTRHIKRFGNYEIDFSAVPALIADDLTFQLELPAPPEVIEAVQEN